MHGSIYEIMHESIYESNREEKKTRITFDHQLPRRTTPESDGGNALISICAKPSILLAGGLGVNVLVEYQYVSMLYYSDRA